MAELNVQPKKKTSWWPWLLVAIILIGLLLLLSRGCNKHDAVASTKPDTTATTNVGPAQTSNTWDNVDFNAPSATYNEITNKDINVSGNDKYAIYSLGENILFDEGKSTLRTDAQKNLQQIATSIKQRYNSNDLRIYGFTDSLGSSDANKQLSQQRADAVRNWFISNGSIADSRISVHAEGEDQPVANNGTAAGRQQNRRVEVVVKK